MVQYLIILKPYLNEFVLVFALILIFNEVFLCDKSIPYLNFILQFCDQYFIP